MEPLRTRHLQDLLHAIGLGADVGPVDGLYGPQTEHAVSVFQEGWTYEDLVVDGSAGPLTSVALLRCADLNGACSPHFRFTEFASPDTLQVSVLRDLVRGLETYREAVRQAVSVVSGYRTGEHNASVGGARNSMHLWGAAADVEPLIFFSEVEALRVFSGIGYDAETGLVRHVDVRATVAYRGGFYNAGTVASPDFWTY